MTWVDLHHELMIMDVFRRSLKTVQVSDLYGYPYETSIWSEASWSHWSTSSLAEIASWQLKNLLFSQHTLWEEEDDRRMMISMLEFMRRTLFFLKSIYQIFTLEMQEHISNSWIRRREKFISKLGQKRERRGPNNQPLVVGKKERIEIKPRALPSCRALFFFSISLMHLLDVCPRCQIGWHNSVQI